MLINEHKTLRQKRQRMREKAGKEGLGGIAELWVNKACSGEEERDS